MTRSVRALVAALLTLACCACTVGPTYRRPDIQPPAAWRTTQAEPGSLADTAWTDLFHDAALQQLIQRALSANTDTRIAAARVLQAEAQVGIVRGAQLPEVSGTADAGRQRTGSRTTATGGVAPSAANSAVAFNTSTAGFSASYLVDFWGRYRRATEQARASLLATQEAQHNVTISVISSVAQAYFQLRALDAQLDVTHSTVAALQESQRLTTVLFQGGVSSELDVRQAESGVELAQANVPALEREIAIQENALSLLLGSAPGDVARGAAIDAQVLPPDVPAGLPSALLERRPDLRQAEAELAAAYAAVGVAEAERLPELALTGSGGLASATLASLLTGPTLVYSLFANLSAPLYSGGRLRSAVALAQAQQSEALVAYEGAFLQALRDVSNGLVSYQKTREQLDAQLALVATEQRVLELSTLRYRSGVATFLDVLDAERQLFSAELTVQQTRGTVFVALVQLYQALGGGWTPQP